MADTYVTLDEHRNHKDVCGRSFDEIKLELQSINKRLFHDNGDISIQTRLIQHESTIFTIKRLTWVIVLASLGTFATAFWAFVFREIVQ